MAQHDLILFDIDGTLANRDTHALLPGVATWFEQHASRHTIALVTNQGGVGLRFWMEGGNQGPDNRFGEPDKFPDELQARAHIDAVNAALPGDPYPAYVCFAYQSKSSGKWAPIPDGCEDDPEWLPDHRKPAPGMIRDAMRDLRSTRAKTLFVGNGKEDRQAAKNADVDYRDAGDFFGRGLPF